VIRKLYVVAHLDSLLEGALSSPRMSTKGRDERIELLQGTLDLLILRTLLLGPRHGHAVAKAIEFNSDEVLQVEQGSLYPALHRLIKRGWISVEDGTSENNRRAKFYRLTASPHFSRLPILRQVCGCGESFSSLGVKWLAGRGHFW
jgi:PadR family transcriptional regulator, regulatory protein PadR